MKIGDRVKVATNNAFNGFGGVIVGEVGPYYQVDLSPSGYMGTPLLFYKQTCTPVNVGASAPSAMPSSGDKSNTDTATSPTVPSPTVERDTVIWLKCFVCGFVYESHYVGFSVVECSTYGCVHYNLGTAAKRWRCENG